MRIQSSVYKEGFFPHEQTIFDPDELDCDLLVLYGGEDIAAELYGQDAIFTSARHVSRRDTAEVEMVKMAVTRGIPIFAVCRGLQLVNVLAGGSLFQDVDEHQGTHPIVTSTGDTFLTNSIHHQMVRLPFYGAELLGWANQNGVRRDDKGTVNSDEPEPEIVYYPEMNCLATQFHPEWMNSRSAAVHYVKQLVKDKLNLNPWG